MPDDPNDPYNSVQPNDNYNSAPVQRDFQKIQQSLDKDKRNVRVQALTPDAKERFISSIEQNKALFEKHKTFLDQAVNKIQQESPGLADKEVYAQALKTLLTTGQINEDLHKLYTQVPPHSMVKECDFLLDNQERLLNELIEKGKIRHNRDNPPPIPRTFTLSLEDDGSIDFYVETKSKMATLQEMLGGQSLKLPEEAKDALKKAGTEKMGKPCWKLSPFRPEGPEEYFSLVFNRTLGTIIDKPSNITEIEYLERFGHPFDKETEKTADFRDNDHIACLEGGIIYVSKAGLIKAVSYAKAAVSSLNVFISEAGEGLTTLDHQKASEKQRYVLIKDILLGLKAIHDQNYVQQDLKPLNVLVYKTQDPLTKTIAMRAKISDFGMTTTIIEPTEEPVASGFYASPEIFDFQLRSKITNYKKSFQDFDSFAYGLEKEIQEQIQSNPDANSTPAKHNDMWALGIMVYEILYGPLPKVRKNACRTESEQAQIDIFIGNIKKNGLLSGLLNPNSDERLTVDQALKKVEFRIQVAADTEAMEAERMETTKRIQAEYQDVERKAEAEEAVRIVAEQSLGIHYKQETTQPAINSVPNKLAATEPASAVFINTSTKRSPLPSQQPSTSIADQDLSHQTPKKHT